MTENKNTVLDFIIELKSKNSKARHKEALNKIEKLYPYALTEKQIYIEETENKGKYKIFINESGFEKSNRKLKTFLFAGLVIIVSSLISFVIIKKHLQEKKSAMEEQNKIEELNSIKIKQSEENKKLAVEKESHWHKLCEESLEKVFPRIELIYSLTGKECFIETLLIEKENFSLELRTKDSVKILSNFESSPFLYEIKMNRTTVSDKNDFISLSGKFEKNILQAEENISDKEKADFYQNLILKNEERKILQKNTGISDYVKKLRDLLHKNKCREQYITLKGEKSNPEIEVLLYSSSKNVLDFVNELQSEESLFDVKRIKISANENPEKILTEITFKTAYEIKESDAGKLLLENYDFNFSTNDIGKVLYKAPSTSTTNVNQKNTSSQKNTEKNSNTKINTPEKNLTYIGLSKINGERFFIVKDEEMNVIYSLKNVDSEIKENCCFESNGKLTAKIRDEYFEVKR